MANVAYTELQDTGLIAADGDDAVAFLHAQLTSDVAGLAAGRTQYSGYCTSQGRLLATFLIWRSPERLYLQLPRSMREAIQTRLAKYVLRSRVKLADASDTQVLFGIWGPDAGALVAALARRAPSQPHELVHTDAVAVTALPVSRFLLMTSLANADEVRHKLAAAATAEPHSAWSRLDIGAGVPVLTPGLEDRFVPQMVNLDLIGALSYEKGCYPGQEIVARTHFLGRLKQRMYRVRVESADVPSPGDPLYSAAFGAEQASGTMLSVVGDSAGGHHALAVIQIGAAGDAHLRSPDGPPLLVQTLPYHLPT